MDAYMVILCIWSTMHICNLRLGSEKYDDAMPRLTSDGNKQILQEKKNFKIGIGREREMKKYTKPLV